MEGLRWLARVGPAPLEAWRCAMLWSEVAARRHARRLEDAGWIARYPMIRGSGCLFVATRGGIRTAGFRFRATGTPAPTFWAHHSACAWTATWLGLLGHEFLGSRELAHDSRWIDEITWQDRKGYHQAQHRPDLVALTKDGRRIPIEIALTRPSKNRLRANLQMYSRWQYRHGTDGVMYIWRSKDILRFIWKGVQENLLEEAVLVREIDVIAERARKDSEQSRQARRTASAEVSVGSHEVG